MKKIITCSLAFLLLLTSLFNPDIYASMNRKFMEIDEPYAYSYANYSVQGEEWRKLTQEEKIQARTIPEEILYSMTPKALAETILYYPDCFEVFLFDTIQEGYDHMGKQEVFQLAYKTRGVAQEILKIYKHTETEYMKESDFRDKYIIHLSFTMAQWVILDQLTDAELLSLVEIAREKKDVARPNEDSYAFNRADELVLLRALERLYGFDDVQLHLNVEDKESNGLNINRLSRFIKTGNYLNIYGVDEGSKGTTVSYYLPAGNMISATYTYGDPEGVPNIQLLNQEMIGKYGGTLLGNSTTRYNCHSYAFINSLYQYHWLASPTSYIEPTNTGLMNYILKATQTANFNMIPQIVGNGAYYKAVYLAGVNGDIYTHSAMVYNSTHLVSKWGNGPLVIHKPMESPYFDAQYLGASNVTTSIRYYQMNTNYVNSQWP